MELKPGYKLTDLGVIPNDWRTPEVGEVCGFIVPGRNKPKLFDGDIPWITTPDMEEGQTVTSSRLGLHISRAEAKLIGSKIVPPGSVLMSCAGELGIVALTQNEIVVNQQLHVFIPTECIEKKFLLNALAYQKNQIASFGTKTAVPYLNKSSCNSILIPLPPLPEQRSIATALSDMDELLGGLDRLITKKRDLKQSAMQQLLTGKTRLPGFDGGWKLNQLKELAHVQRGASPRPIDNPIWFNNSSLIGWVRISDVTRSGMYLCETYQQLSPLGIQHSRPVAKGSLIMSICATVGRPIITKIDVCIHDGFVVFDNLQADQLFMYYVLKWIEPDWYKHGQTGSQMNLNTELINGTTIHVPPLPEQIAIASILSDMDTEIATLEQRRNKTRDLKQAMMQELLTGRIRLL